MNVFGGKMKKILIFGATGNIGAYFVDYCKNNLPSDYEVIAVGNLEKSSSFRKSNCIYLIPFLLKKSVFLLPTAITCPISVIVNS